MPRQEWYGIWDRWTDNWYDTRFWPCPRMARLEADKIKKRMTVASVSVVAKMDAKEKSRGWFWWLPRRR